MGKELSLDECTSEAVDDACLSHASDAIIFCGLNSFFGVKQAVLEIVLATSKTWAPVCKAGFTSGAAGAGGRGWRGGGRGAPQKCVVLTCAGRGNFVGPRPLGASRWRCVLNESE